MPFLDNKTKIKKLDRANVLGSIERLGMQCSDAWQAASAVSMPASYATVKNIVINGMGGSALGGEIIQFLFWEKLKLPLQVINSYTLPGSVNADTLYIVSSYSGNTEEPLGTVIPALRRGAKVLGIAKGGKIGQLIRAGKFPGYLIQEKHNPCGQPRMGIGYSVFGQLGLLQQCGVLQLTDREVQPLIKTLKRLNSRFGLNAPQRTNPAKQIAAQLAGRMPVIVVADFLAGNAHALRNQINENAKNFANYFVVSEMNHHLMEGLRYPRKGNRSLRWLFIDSDQYYPANQKRMAITKRVVDKNGLDILDYKLHSKTKLEQSFEMLVFGGYVNFYLAMLNRVDPSPIPWVDYFKAELVK
ncbi:hypothetical protein HY933_02835 [Candidatus Falkowbacteria bacterium]|nr:hypothetical protein [Candidatus Falkowbacteria bacterium]